MRAKGAGESAALGRDFDQIYSDVEAYYAARVTKYGATPLGVDWLCQATQSLRFVQLLKICDFSTPFSLNDVGCGYGALCAFLDYWHPDCRINYLGVDLSKAMISRARRRFSGPDQRFVIGKVIPRVADYSIASGILNVNVGYSRAVWEDFIATTLREMCRASRRGFSVNFMSEAGIPKTPIAEAEEGLYRTKPEPWFRYCKDELGCSVELLNDYGMREFTLLARCRQGAD